MPVVNEARWLPDFNYRFEIMINVQNNRFALVSSTQCRISESTGMAKWAAQFSVFLDMNEMH